MVVASELVVVVLVDVVARDALRYDIDCAWTACYHMACELGMQWSSSSRVAWYSAVGTICFDGFLETISSVFKLLAWHA